MVPAEGKRAGSPSASRMALLGVRRIATVAARRTFHHEAKPVIRVLLSAASIEDLHAAKIPLFYPTPAQHKVATHPL
jgi:hypothetical protein